MVFIEQHNKEASIQMDVERRTLINNVMKHCLFFWQEGKDNMIIYQQEHIFAHDRKGGSEYEKIYSPLR